MAFIRDYAMQAGDPFRFKFKRPKISLKGIGRALKKVAPLASFLPIPGAGVIGAAAALVRRGRKAAQPLEQAIEVARSYGVAPETMSCPSPATYDELPVSPAPMEEEVLTDEGDLARLFGYAGDPAPRPARKRKMAGAGPRAKAAKKAQKRAERGRRGIDLGALGRGAAQLGGLALDVLPGGGLAKLAAKFGLGAIQQLTPQQQQEAQVTGRMPKGARIGGHRRRINPLNVKALRRAGSRMDGFGRAVKRYAPHLLEHHGAKAGHFTYRGKKKGRGRAA